MNTRTSESTPWAGEFAGFPSWKREQRWPLKCHRLSALQASQMNRHLRSSGSPGRQKERPNCRTCRSLQPSGTRLRTHWHHGDTSISNSTTVWQIRSIEHEFSFDLALTRLSRKDRRRASNAWKCWPELSRDFRSFCQPSRTIWLKRWRNPDKMQACQRGLLETACNSWLSLSYRSHPKDLQDIIDDIDAQFWNHRSVASSVLFETHQLQLKAKAMISQLALAA